LREVTRILLRVTVHQDGRIYRRARREDPISLLRKARHAGTGRTNEAVGADLRVCPYRSAVSAFSAVSYYSYYSWGEIDWITVGRLMR